MLSNALLVLLLTLMSVADCSAFKTLAEITDYAATLQEFPKASNDNLLNLNYHDFYQSLVPTPFSRIVYPILQALHLKGRPLWSLESYSKVLEQVTLQNEKAGYKGDYILKLTPDVNAKFVMWGDLHSAFHSLARDLVQLRALGIIDADLNIMKPNYFVFNGNVIDRGPYSLETLTVVLSLMQKNPQQVIYLRGSHEADKVWYDYSTKQELEIRAGDASASYDASLDRFFNTLPTAMFLASEDKYLNQPSFARIGYFNVKEKPWLNEDNIADFLLNRSMIGPEMLLASQIVTSTVKPKTYPDIKIVVEGVDRTVTFQYTNGLAQLIPEKGATTWNVLSCPSHCNELLYKFFNDAFIMLSTKPKINDWTLALFTHNVQEARPTFESTIKHALTGRTLQSMDEIVEARELRIGSINDVSKSASGIGKRLRKGLTARVIRANSEEEIRGKYIRLIFYDDRYTPRITVQSMWDLRDRYNTDVILQTLGSATHEALLPFVKKKEILVAFSFSGPLEFRKPELTYNVHYRTSYQQEGETLVDYAVKTLEMKIFAGIYQNDAFGKALLKGAQIGIEKTKATLVDASYQRNTLNVKAAVKKITESDPEVILCFGVRSLFMALIDALGVISSNNKRWLGQSFLTDIFRNMLKSDGLNLTLTRVVPNPLRDDLEMAREYRGSVAAYRNGDPITVDSFEAYISASLLIKAILMNNGDVNKDKLVEMFHQMKDMDYKGLQLNYDPQTQELSRYKDVWVDDGHSWLYFPGVQPQVKPAQQPSILTNLFAYGKQLREIGQPYFFPGSVLASLTIA